MNAILIKQGLPQKQRLQTLNEIAIDQMKTLLGQGNGSMKKLK
jgi:hypothetical protein